MSRLLLYRPRHLKFKHFIELDIYKWLDNYESIGKIIGQCVTYGNINMCNILLQLSCCRPEDMYGSLVGHSWVDKLPKYLLDVTSGKKIDESQRIQCRLLNYGILNLQLDVIYRFRKLENIDDFSFWHSTDERAIRIQIYMCKNLDYKKQKYINYKKCCNTLKQYYGSGIINQGSDWQEKLEARYKELLKEIELYE